MLVGRLTSIDGTRGFSGTATHRLSDPAQLMPMPMPGGQLAWIVAPLPVAELHLAPDALTYGVVDEQTAEQYQAQLAAVSAAKAGLSIPRSMRGH